MVRPLVAILALWAAGCTGRGPETPQGRQLTGTCDGTCDYYLGCKRMNDASVRRECVADCQLIFVEDGQPDHRNLRELESLECRELVLYIEGESGRAPGQAPAPPSAPSSSARR